MDRAETRAEPIPEGVSEPRPRLAEIQVLTPFSIVVPTYHEAANLPGLLERIAQLRETLGVDLEVLIMDDQSRDGSVEVVHQAAHDWATIVVRTGPRGLSPAVVEGLQRARYPVVVVMDADLSHPPEKIPDLILALDSGQQFALGSRYVPGGSTDDKWGFFRWLNSRIATWLARPLTDARDPMSGFFAFRKAELARARYLNPIGYKIGLEIIVKCGLENVGEVPIHFADRQHGQSKLTFAEQLKYLRHLQRLYLYQLRYTSPRARFVVVGTFGVLVNLSVLTLLVFLGVSALPALAASIVISLLGNAVANTWLEAPPEPSATFSSKPADGPRSGTTTDFESSQPTGFWQRLAGFATTSALGGLINATVAGVLILTLETWPVQVAALAGIAAGSVCNNLTREFLDFKRRMG